MPISLCAIRWYGLVNMPFDAFFKFADCCSRLTRGHSLKLLHPDARINACSYLFIIQLTVYNGTMTRFIADDKVVYQ